MQCAHPSSSPPGAIASFSLAFIPSLVSHLRAHPPNSPTRAAAEAHSLSIFRHVYGAGKASAPLIAMASASLCFGNAYRLRNSAAALVPTYALVQGLASWQYALVAGVLNLAIAPFTVLVIAPTNELLFAREEACKVGGVGGQEGEEKVKAVEVREGGGESEALFRRWMWLNFARAAFPALGAVAAWIAC